MNPSSRLHELRATPATCFWGFFDNALPPVLRVRSGDIVHVETLTHQADAYSLVSVAADFAVTQIVDMRQSVHGAIPKSVFLPR